jgi:hypothetical protein
MRCTTGATYAHGVSIPTQGRRFAKGVTGNMAYDTMLATVGFLPLIVIHSLNFHSAVNSFSNELSTDRKLNFLFIDSISLIFLQPAEVIFFQR